MNTIQDQPSLRLLLRHREKFPPSDLECSQGLHALLEHLQFEAMSKAFRPHGGFVSGDDVMHRLRRLVQQPASTLERWLASRKVLNVWWRDQTLMPMFQFDLENMTVRPACARVVDELKAVFDDWELTLWFATPNTWLNGMAPVTLLTRDDVQVLQAARADRFVCRG